MRALSVAREKRLSWRRRARNLPLGDRTATSIFASSRGLAGLFTIHRSTCSPCRPRCSRCSDPGVHVRPIRLLTMGRLALALYP